MMKPTCVSTGTLNASEGVKVLPGEFHFEFHTNSVSMSWKETHLALISVKQDVNNEQLELLLSL